MPRMARMDTKKSSIGFVCICEIRGGSHLLTIEPHRRDHVKAPSHEVTSTGAEENLEPHLNIPYKRGSLNE